MQIRNPTNAAPPVEAACTHTGSTRTETHTAPPACPWKTNTKPTWAPRSPSTGPPAASHGARRPWHCARNPGIHESRSGGTAQRPRLRCVLRTETVRTARSCLARISPPRLCLHLRCWCWCYLLRRFVVVCSPAAPSSRVDEKTAGFSLSWRLAVSMRLRLGAG